MPPPQQLNWCESETGFEGLLQGDVSGFNLQREDDAMSDRASGDAMRVEMCVCKQHKTLYSAA